MAVYKIFPEQDASIYSQYPTMNAGLDPILDISNNSIYQVARSLIKFNQEEINSVINNSISGSNFEAYLKAYISNVEGITQDTILEIYPISGSWSNGNGQYLDSPLNSSGVSWYYQNYEINNIWNTGSSQNYVTSSCLSNNLGGGTWFTGSDNPNASKIFVTQSFNNRTDFDLNVGITDIIKTWYSSSNNINSSYTDIANEGLIIKLDKNTEFNLSSSVQPIFNFYSVDTNTIYPPTIEFKWDDSIYNTGSLSIITDSDVVIGLSNNPGIFNVESINKFNVNVRPEFPVRVYQTSSLYTKNYILPKTSYYAVKDLDTNEYVIKFDNNYTKISCDSSGSYFNLNMNGLEPQRNYNILIKTIINGETIIKDENYYFKIEK